MDKLKKLLVRVKIREFQPADCYNVPHLHDWSQEAGQAYSGSLDAAKALLPGWIWARQGHLMTVTDDHTGRGGKPHFSARDDINPARAWLIAILKALIAERE